MKYGILGGTFNPPHIGHLVIAETAADELGLETVFFVPAADPPHKVGVPRASVEDRVNMVQLAIHHNPAFRLSRADVDRPGPHYTNDMIRLFREQFPGQEPYFLMGSDSLRDLLSWYEPQGLIEQCYLVVMSRPVVPPDMDILYAELPLLREKLIFIHSPEISISSTNITARLKSGRSIRYRVPDAVWEYIYAHDLYTR
ncbi:MAG: nicotinate (nicotinamide) nucleotide adenylyltransferase [Anaerolineae bacterium]|nr:nicotinate (nicotinamide) nucleotide adenylyltransferase [Anaerolineae bacterium]